jgi:spermidine/putrescine transport system permease protein
MRTYAVFIYAFLYLPIVIIAVFSFNAGHYAMDWRGFSFQWYATAWNNPFVMQALQNSLIVAGGSAILSMIIGTAAALGIERVRNSFIRHGLDGLVYLAVIVPGIVIGIATLIAAVTVFKIVNPFIEALLGGARLQLGLWSVIAAHVLGSMAVVVLLVRARLVSLDKATIEAAQDLYSTPSGVIRQVLLPLLLPSIIAGGLLSFTFSLDEYIITSFVAGPNTTLPLYVFASIRRGVTPEINAIGTVILFFSFLILIVAQWLIRRGARTP